MDLFKEKRFYKFLIPSIIGCLLFITPLQYQGQLTIPIAVIAHSLLDILSDSIYTLIWLIITCSGMITCVHQIHPISWISKYERLDALFTIRGFWFYIRIIGMIFVNMLYFSCTSLANFAVTIFLACVLSIQFAFKQYLL